MDPPYFCQTAVRCYDTICLFPVFRAFFSVTFLGLLHVSDPAFPTYSTQLRLFFILSSLFPAFFLDLDTFSAASS